MTAELSETDPRPQISLWTILTSYFVVGLTAFGMAILQKLKGLVKRNKWISEQERNEILTLAVGIFIVERYFKIHNLAGFSWWGNNRGLLFGSGTGKGG